MRQIDVDVDVFALIWANRRPPEIDENEILKRILVGLSGSSEPSHAQPTPPGPSPLPGSEEADNGFQRRVSSELKEVFSSNDSRPTEKPMTVSLGKTRWVDDVQVALLQLGGVASLHRIYKKVEEIRRFAGRSVPKTLEATVRRTIEDHSSDSENFRGADIFTKVARGEWALREKPIGSPSG